MTPFPVRRTLWLLPALLAACNQPLPLPSGNPPSSAPAPAASLSINGNYVLVNGQRMYGGETLKVTLNHAPAGADVNWSSNEAQLDAPTSKDVSVPYSSRNRAALSGGPVTITAYNGTAVLAQLTVNVDDKEPSTVEGIYGIWPGEIKRVLNPQMYVGSGVRFGAQYTDSGAGMASSGESLPLQVWRNNIKQRELLTNTSELLEAGNYEVRAATIADKLGNRAGEEPQVLSVFHTDFTPPRIESSRDNGAVILPKTEGHDEGEVVISLSDPPLADGYAGSGIREIQMIPALGYTPGTAGNQIIRIKHSDFAKAGLAGEVTLNLTATDAAGNAQQRSLTLTVAP